ncbi:MAG: hypothetical protein ACI9F9_003037 [Candidatus Paceibacteria bacterium]|jgi:hypothetical protein
MKILVTASLALLSLAPFQRAPELNLESFDHLLEQIQPTADELAWDVIEWHASLGSAIVEAQWVQKPIVLWAMNGHPLGCV